MANQNSKLNFIDAMRGIAILMVILVHTAQSIPHKSAVSAALAAYGQMGVQLFFVASAYTLCLSFERRSSASSGLSSFYIRRIFRIAPLYYLAIPIYFLFHMVVNLYLKGAVPEATPYSLSNIAANVFFVHGFVPEANNTIVPGGWSIGTEMAFYLIFPLLYWVVKRVAGQNPMRFFGLLAALVAINLTVQMLVTNYQEAPLDSLVQNNNFWYFNIINQLPVFLIGMAAFFVDKQRSARAGLTSAYQSWLGFGLLSIAAILLFMSSAPYAFVAVPILAGGSFFFLADILKKFARQNGTLCSIGRVSFSMYIFHFLFASGLVPLVAGKASRWIDGDALLLLAFILTVIPTFFIARVTEKLIEAKGILLGSRLISNLDGRSPIKMHS